MENRFEFFAPAFIRKSGKAGEPIKIGGVITTEDRDIDGEILLTKGLDFSYFTEGWGKIKFEHDNEINKEPDNIIGFPTKLIRKSGRIEFEGELIPFEGIPDEALSPQQRNSKSAYGLLKAVEQFNKQNPTNQQKVGWSVEGDYLEREKKTGVVRKARIVNVVLTSKPRNMQTFATLVKSLTVGYGTSPETQTGLGATRLESIDGIKNNHSLKKGETQMFKSREEAKKSFLSQGLSEEEAEKKAMEWEQNQKADTSAVAKENFGKSISFAKESESVDIDAKNEVLVEKLEKSVKTMRQKDGSVDLESYFEAKQDVDATILEVLTALAEKQDLLAKSLQSSGAGMQNLVDENLELKKALSVVNKRTELIGQLALKSAKLQSNENFAPTDILKSIQFEDNNKASEGDFDVKKLSKSVVVNALDELVSEGKISTLDVVAYEGSGYLDEKVTPLIKAKINNLKK